ncbi:hypothetical protein TVAG_010200 [Trichomonas vaginalis G3]|uniref:Importin N-terminal domain-containing protein n=1 Tax=Trichomonas vaginalis (strain ATCC PRA-98 / G3) TaxID=412133 RepID=A2FA35_TRIV3|nr:armadillo (ARM) repeat-containing protein family [Trichomonas vaginalis G3]EAX98243.1 hypothetical protein TVAG_010200 [Trichomonas vaginalis G3]KAI5543384.1 armadillo (ARM) repeat-containing protein family [Trichomonas vaginalis G3]|eukprot:XP_001311173.1 hypothetical protein [Trichomonas vaginalis G3]
MSFDEKFNAESLIKQVHNFISGNQELSAAANQYLIDLSNNYKIQFTNLCSTILNDIEANSQDINLFMATTIKSFFTENSTRTNAEIEDEWFSDTASQLNLRDTTKNALFSALISQDEGLRNLSAFSLAYICKLETTNFGSLETRFIELLTPTDTPEYYVIGIYNLFCQLLEQSFLENTMELDPPQIIPFLIERGFDSLTDEKLQITTKMQIFQYLDLITEHYPQILYNQQFIDHILDCSFNIILFIMNDIEEKGKVTQILHLIYNIFTIYYHKDVNSWSKISEFLLISLNCTEEDHEHENQIYNEKIVRIEETLRQKKANSEEITKDDKWLLDRVQLENIHERKIPVLFFLQNISDFEWKILKQNPENCHFFIQEICEELLPRILHLMVPFDCDNENIEDIDDQEPSYFATNALNSLVKCCKVQIYPILEEIIKTKQIDNVLVYLNSISALTFGPLMENTDRWLIDMAVNGEIKEMAMKGNKRIQETSLYSIWRILKTQKIQNDDDFLSVFEILKAHCGEEYLIRVRCTDILKEILEILMESNNELFDNVFEETYQITCDLAMTGTDERYYLIEPFKVLANVIVMMNETEENCTKLLNFTQICVKKVTGEDETQKPTIFTKTCYVILLASLCSKLKDILSDHAEEIFSCLMSCFTEYDLELWSDTVAAISFLIDKNKVSSSHYNRLLECFEVVRDNNDNKLKIVMLRLIGKYISLSNPCLSDDCLMFLEKLENIVQAENYSPDVMIGVLFALQQISKYFSFPKDDVLEKIILIIHKIGEYIPVNDPEKFETVGTLILAIFNILIVKLAKLKPDFAKNNYNDMGTFILYLFNNGITSNNVMFGCVNLLRAIGRYVGRKANVFLNKRSFIQILDFADNSDDANLRKLSEDTRHFITSL